MFVIYVLIGLALGMGTIRHFLFFANRRARSYLTTNAALGQALCNGWTNDVVLYTYVETYIFIAISM